MRINANTFQSKMNGIVCRLGNCPFGQWNRYFCGIQSVHVHRRISRLLLTNWLWFSGRFGSWTRPSLIASHRNDILWYRSCDIWQPEKYAFRFHTDSRKKWVHLRCTYTHTRAHSHTRTRIFIHANTHMSNKTTIKSLIKLTHRKRKRIISDWTECISYPYNTHNNKSKK